jgi:hypothetical protein
LQCLHICRLVLTNHSGKNVVQHITKCTQCGANTTLQRLFMWYDRSRDIRRQRKFL